MGFILEHNGNSNPTPRRACRKLILLLSIRAVHVTRHIYIYIYKRAMTKISTKNVDKFHTIITRTHTHTHIYISRNSSCLYTMHEQLIVLCVE